MFTVKKIALALALLCSAAAAFAQQRYPVSQYEQNRYSYIPAVAGVDDAYHVNSMAHLQAHDDSLAWQSLALNVSGPLNMLPFSLGFGVFNEQTDLYLLGTTQLTGAYHFERGASRFSAALSLGAARYEFTGFGLLSLVGDTLSNRRRYLPDLGVSAFFTHAIFYAGVAVQHIGNFAHKLTPNGEHIGKKLQQQVYLLGGANLSFPAAQLSLKPSMMLSYMSREVGVAASIMLDWRDMLWVGISGKTTRQAGFMAGVNILKKYVLSYSCDLSFASPKQPLAHEISLGVNFETLRQK